MKLFRVTMLFVLMLAGVSVQAQGMKIGFANLDSVIASMPETETKMKELQTFGTKLQEELQRKQQTFQRKYQEAAEQAQSLPPAVLQQKQKELQELEAEIVEFQQNAQQDLARKEQQVLTPLYEKAKAEIKKIAEEGSYHYIIIQNEQTSIPLLYADPALDLTAEIIKRLKG